MSRPTHIDEAGNARMVDVGDKDVTERVAVAEGSIALGEEALRIVREGGGKKGDVLAVAQLAGIQAAKRTPELIPLCHVVPLSGLDVTLTVEGSGVRCRAEARATWRTGVEMEALVAVSAALLTVYDMLKAVDRGMSIEGVRLLEKRGGRSGHWTRG